MRRRLVLKLAVVTLLAVAGGVAWPVFRPRPRFTMEQVERIQVGMTLNEVAAALGCPPGDYTDDLSDGSPTTLCHRQSEEGSSSPISARAWAGQLITPGRSIDSFRRDVVLVYVDIDCTGRVVSVGSCDWSYPPPTALDRLRWYAMRAWVNRGF